jgi:uncharacterized protein YggE
MNPFHRATLCIALATAPTLAAANAQTIQVNKQNRTIAVNATDIATAEADTATVHIGFQVFAPDSDTAYSSGSQVSNLVVDTLKKAGVSEKAIESESQGVQRNQQFDDKESASDRSKRQYSLQQSWTVRTSASDAAKVLDMAVKAGANNSGAIDWDVSDRKALQAKAAANALARAQAIASQMAAALNVAMKGLIYASNQAEPAVRPMPMYDRMSFAADAKREVQPLAINPRRIEESATVYAVFAIE